MKKILSMALVLIMLFALAVPAMAANGDGDITANLVKQSDGTALLTVTYTSGNNSIKAATFELVGTDYKSGVVPFDKKSGTFTFVLDSDVPANTKIIMTEDKGNKPVVVNGVFKEGFHIHKYSTSTTLPNCTEKGYITNLCLCGDSYKSDYVNELGHNYSKIIITMTPESDGYTMNICTRKGCGYSYESDRVECKPYEWQVVKTVEPTCTEQGYTVYKDEYWNIEKIDDYKDALTHDYESVVKVPTCTEGGYTTHTCQREGCTDSYTDDEKDALDHNWVAGTITAPTCTLQGYTAYTCDRDGCGASKDDDFKPALGHDMSEVLNEEATCLEIGYEEYAECSRCDYTEGKILEALDHDMSEALNEEATCLDIGYAEYSVCSRCDYTEGKILEALDHDMSEALNEEATCLDIGYAEYSVCSRCDYTEGKILEALGHDWDEGTYTNPTREADGYTTYTCTRNDCDATKVVTDEGSQWVVTGATAKLTSSGSDYTITVTETYSGGVSEIYTSIFKGNEISNGGNKTFDVGPYKVTVSRSGGTYTPGTPVVPPQSSQTRGSFPANEAVEDNFTFEIIDIIRVD